LVLYNPPFPGQRLQYYLAPGFALGTKKLVGGGDIRWRMHPAGNAVKRITVGINGRSFHDDYRGRDVQYYTRFYRITPNIRFDLRSKNLAIQQSIEGRFHFIGQEIGRQDTIFPDIPGGPLTFVANKRYVRNNIWDLTYRLSNTARPNPFSLATTLEGQNWDDAGVSKSYLRLSTTWTQQLYYANKKKVGIRFYAGTFLQNSSSDRKSVGFGATDAFARGSLSLAQNGYTDYKYDYIFLNRNGDSGFLSRQTQMAEGGFKYAFSSAYAASGDVGHSNKLLLALNLTADLPKKLPLGLPIKPYFDLGWANQSYLPGSNEDRSIGDQLFWSGGFSLELLKGAANVYFPVYSSKQLQRLYRESGNYLQRITWSFRLDGWEPRETALREFR
jgi:hypothetical protein